jgi:protein tyrosine phosphatase (PTP) superfamily phosphohydrolase (DUF442 family)
MPVPQDSFSVVEQQALRPVPQEIFCYCRTGRRARSIFFGKLKTQKL